MTDKIMCPCGSPQSYPIPHEHDQTKREKQIIKYYNELVYDLREALEDIIEQAEKTHLPLGADLADSIRVFGKQALAKVRGK